MKIFLISRRIICKLTHLQIFKLTYFQNKMIHRVLSSEVDTLLNLARKTFYDAFAHQNNPDDFEAYTATAFTREALLAEIDNPESAFYFALIDNDPVGYIKLNYGTAQAEYQDAEGVEVSRLYVHAGHQGKKIGNQLLDFAINKSAEDGLEYIWLGVWDQNYAAQRFYTRNGFEPVGTHAFVIGTDVQTDILMKRELVND